MSKQVNKNEVKNALRRAADNIEYAEKELEKLIIIYEKIILMLSKSKELDIDSVAKLRNELLNTYHRLRDFTFRARGEICNAAYKLGILIYDD
jgi:hypothetical protein